MVQFIMNYEVCNISSTEGINDGVPEAFSNADGPGGSNSPKQRELSMSFLSVSLGSELAHHMRSEPLASFSWSSLICARSVETTNPSL